MTIRRGDSRYSRDGARTGTAIPRTGRRTRIVQRLLAEHDRAGGAQVGDGRRGFARDVVEKDFRMAGRRLAGDIDIIFRAERDAVQRPQRPAGENLRLGPARSLERAFGVDADEGAAVRIVRLYLANERSHQFDRR
jgi:hypothetical protein